jgi:hypothetical protein
LAHEIGRIGRSIFKIISTLANMETIPASTTNALRILQDVIEIVPAIFGSLLPPISALLGWLMLSTGLMHLAPVRRTLDLFMHERSLKNHKEDLDSVFGFAGVFGVLIQIIWVMLTYMLRSDLRFTPWFEPEYEELALAERVMTSWLVVVAVIEPMMYILGLGIGLVVFMDGNHRAEPTAKSD